MVAIPILAGIAILAVLSMRRRERRSGPSLQPAYVTAATVLLVGLVIGYFVVSACNVMIGA